MVRPLRTAWKLAKGHERVTAQLGGGGVLGQLMVDATEHRVRAEVAGRAGGGSRPQIVTTDARLPAFEAAATGSSDASGRGRLATLSDMCARQIRS